MMKPLDLREYAEGLRRVGIEWGDEILSLIEADGQRRECGDYIYEVLVKDGLCVGDDAEPFIDERLKQAKEARGVVQSLLNRGHVLPHDMTPAEYLELILL